MGASIVVSSINSRIIDDRSAEAACSAYDSLNCEVIEIESWKRAREKESVSSKFVYQKNSIAPTFSVLTFELDSGGHANYLGVEMLKG